VLEDVSGGVALARIAHQQVADQILALLRHAAPLGLWELIETVLDGGEEHLLASTAHLTALPATVRATLAVERWVAAQHDVPAVAEGTVMTLRANTCRETCIVLQIMLLKQ